MTEGNTVIPITFKIYDGDEVSRTEEFSQDIIKIGKMAKSHLCIDDESVSRMHAVVEVSDREAFIIDLGSTAGTIVNGKKVNKSALVNGDELQIGSARIVVEMPEVEEVAEPAAAAPAAAVANPFAAAIPNPFASAVAEESDDEDDDNILWGIQASRPAEDARDVDSAESVLEVTILWGDLSVLHVAHLNPPRTYYVGESDGKDDPVDYLMSAEGIGTQRMPVVVANGMDAAAVIPPGATGSVTIGDETTTFEELEAAGKLQPCPEYSGAKQFALPAEASVRVEHKEFVFMTKATSAARRVGVGRAAIFAAAGTGVLAYIAGTVSVTGALLTAMYFSPPYTPALNVDLLAQDSRLMEFLMESPETVEEEEVEWLDQAEDEDSGGEGERHEGEEGQMGEESSEKTNNRYAIEGEVDEPEMAREEQREEARTAGILGTLATMTGSWNSPTSPYGADVAVGSDPMSAMGALMGDQAGSNFGFGGLGLRGTGRGGGGTGQGTIGLGNIGTIGHGGGGGSGQGYGRGAGGLGARAARVPRIRSGAADVRGSLSREVIRRVVRRNIQQIRFCYEQQLAARPDLEGRVTVTFIIAPTGAVQTSLLASSTLGNATAEQCIVRSARRWSFPAPEGGGIVRVNYPFMLSQQGG